MHEALTLPGVETGVWQVRNRFDSAAVALADRHYSRRPGKIGSNQVGGVGRALVLVTPCERALWVTRWLQPDKTYDHLDAYRCSYFRNEGAGLSSRLILEAARLTIHMWGPSPPDGWVTWIDTRKVPGTNPGYCFKQAGWQLDRAWTHRHLVRLVKRHPAALDTEGDGVHDSRRQSKNRDGTYHTHRPS